MDRSIRENRENGSNREANPCELKEKGNIN